MQRNLGLHPLAACNGDGSWKSAVHILVGPQPARVVMADFDGDQRPDVAVTHFGALGSMSVLGGLGMNWAAAVALAARHRAHRARARGLQFMTNRF